MKTLDGISYAGMIRGGAANLKAHAKEIDDLNVFPIPDGDTGDNMLMTVMGGLHSDGDAPSLSVESDAVARGMLMSARGNSGVILSQFFEGIKQGFAALDDADCRAIGEAFRQGVSYAYASVMTPTEGTILTVIREATEYACASNADTPEAFLEAFLDEAGRSLERTPDLLPVLKKAGVVDSGGAGLVCIVEGMLMSLRGKEPDFSEEEKQTAEIDLNAFDEYSVLEYGYCTELLLRLQWKKTDLDSFDVSVISDFLQTVGDSVVAVRNGSIVKIHVHTETPYKVLEFCQKYGEYLTVKIENMSLQHNRAESEKEASAEQARKKFGVVAVASGEGLKQIFLDRGADVIVDGGQCMNPSAEDFISAFDRVNADVIFVYPNNGNIVLTAEQAARLYEKSDVRVIPSTSIGAGYSSLAMFDPNSEDADVIAEELTDAMDGVITAEISHCVRDAVIDGTELHSGDYIGFMGKRLLSVGKDRFEVLCNTVEHAGFSRRDICIVFCGKDASDEESGRLLKYIEDNYRGKEVYILDGGQDVYDYIVVIE